MMMMMMTLLKKKLSWTSLIFPEVLCHLCAQLLQFYSDSFETLQMSSLCFEDVHVVWILFSDKFLTLLPVQNTSVPNRGDPALKENKIFRAGFVCFCTR